MWDGTFGSIGITPNLYEKFRSESGLKTKKNRRKNESTAFEMAAFGFRAQLPLCSQTRPVVLEAIIFASVYRSKRNSYHNQYNGVME